MPTTLTCPRCDAPDLPVPAGADGRTALSCGNCQAGIEIDLLTPPAVPAPRLSAGASTGEASCFFCEGQAATDECSMCGRFVCDRCKVDWAGSVTCMTCLHASREIKDSDAFNRRRVIYDNVALSFMLLPLLLPIYGVFFSLMMTPVSFFFLVRYWNAPRGIVPRGRARQYIALGISVFVIVGSAIGMILLLNL